MLSGPPHVESAGLAFWLQEWATASVDDIRAGILASSEYYQHAGGTDERFIHGIYDLLLERTPDAVGLKHWMSRLASSTGEARLQIVQAIMTSTEGVAARAAREA